MDVQTIGECAAGATIASAVYLGEGKPWRRMAALTIGLPVTLSAILVSALLTDSPLAGWDWIMGN